MRGTFVKTLVELAERDPRIVLLTGDLGFMVLEAFAERFPDRFYNVGVAEQNMVGIATGLAEAGFIPFTYSIATFSVLRPFEFIRNGPVLHQLPVRIVGVGGGFEYGAAGTTHYGLEDLGVTRTQPGLKVIAPADYEQTRAALLSTYDLPAPIYYRLGKNDRDALPGLDGRFDSDDVQIVREGKDVLFLAVGSVSFEAVAAAEALAQHGLDAGVAVVACLNPSPEQALAALMTDYRTVVTVEAHVVNGGLGSLVAETIAEHGLNCRLMRCGVRQPADGRSGSERSMHRLHGLDAESLTSRVLQTVSVAHE